MKEVVVDMQLSAQANSGKESKGKCEEWVWGGLAHKPFLHPQYTATKILKPINTDICGPVETLSLAKCCYFVLFTDGYTR